MRTTRQHFDVLGVTPADDITTIRMAWRAKVWALHPDRARDKARATEALAEVNAAFDALQGHVPKQSDLARKPVSNPARRKAQHAHTQTMRAQSARHKAGSPADARASSAQWAPKTTTPDPALQALCKKALSGYRHARQNMKAA